MWRLCSNPPESGLQRWKTEQGEEGRPNCNCHTLEKPVERSRRRKGKRAGDEGGEEEEEEERRSGITHSELTVLNHLKTRLNSEGLETQLEV